MVNYEKRVVSVRDLFPLIKNAIKEGKNVKFTVSGNSMQPWITNNRDQVLLSAADEKHLKKGDIILFESSYNRYILHRIYKMEEEGCHTIGDACLIEDGTVLMPEIIGVVKKIYRKGKEINCDSLLWRFVFNIWRWLLPFRKYLLGIYFLMRKLKRGLKKVLQSLWKIEKKFVRFIFS